MLKVLICVVLILIIIGLIFAMIGISPMVLESYFDAVDILKKRKRKRKEKELLKDVVL